MAKHRFAKTVAGVALAAAGFAGVGAALSPSSPAAVVHTVAHTAQDSVSQAPGHLAPHKGKTKVHPLRALMVAHRLLRPHHMFYRRRFFWNRRTFRRLFR